MPNLTNAFDQYTVRYYTLNAQDDLVAYIHCFDGKGTAGAMYFYPNGTQLPANSGKNNIIHLRFQEKELSNILDILRHEKPLYLFYSDKGDRGWLTTDREEVGEEES